MPYWSRQKQGKRKRAKQAAIDWRLKQFLSNLSASLQSGRENERRSCFLPRLLAASSPVYSASPLSQKWLKSPSYAGLATKKLRGRVSEKISCSEKFPTLTPPSILLFITFSSTSFPGLFPVSSREKPWERGWLLLSFHNHNWVSVTVLRTFARKFSTR